MSAPAAISAIREQLALTRQVENLIVKVEGIKTYATYAGTKSGGGGIFGDQDVPADVVGTDTA